MMDPDARYAWDYDERYEDDDALLVVVVENPEIITMAEALAQAKIEECPF